jgi:primase-polymerase (primpol)-like protein
VSAFDRIPAEVRALETWVVWRKGKVDPKTGKPKKPPFCATDLRRHGSSTNPETWSTFEQAVAVVEAGKADGIGFALAPPYVGVDLDEEMSEADRYAIALALNSYTEMSVSGTGLHVILRATLNGGRHPTGIGVFQEGRLWYCSGKHVHGTPWEIAERQAELDAVLAEFVPAVRDIPNDAPTTSSTGRTVDLDDRELLERMFASKSGEKIRGLWGGDWSAYESQSQADQALCDYLAFWTDRDAGRMETMFRDSGLYREEGPQKPKGIGYLARTIETAIAGTSEGYNPGRDKHIPESERVSESVVQTASSPAREGSRDATHSRIPSVEGIREWVRLRLHRGALWS